MDVGTVLDGVLFSAGQDAAHGGTGRADTVLIAITGIHGNFYSNPFYYNIGETLSAGGMDFIYAQTNDAFGQIETYNANTGEKADTDDPMESVLKGGWQDVQ